MKNEAIISVSDRQSVTWLPWSACAYADSLAIFRFMLTDTVVTQIRTNSLQPDELERANRYHRSADRNRFVYGRHLVRGLLAHYTNQLPNEVRFTISTNRKPTVINNSDWYFNVSHSGDWVLVSVGRNAVGIDIETLDSAFAFDTILPTSFTTAEQQFILTQATPSSAFYQLWTRKEALVKATGKGVDDDFPTIPSLTGQHTLDSHVLGATGDWLVQSFDVTTNYPAAVAFPTGLGAPKFYTIDSGFFTHFTS